MANDAKNVSEQAQVVDIEDMKSDNGREAQDDEDDIEPIVNSVEIIVKFANFVSL